MSEQNLSAAGKRIVEGLTEVLADVRGEKKLPARRVTVPDEVDIVAARKRFEMSQAEFAATFGISLASLRNWEQGHRKPSCVARAYLAVIEKEPEAVRRALGR